MAKPEQRKLDAQISFRLPGADEQEFVEAAARAGASKEEALRCLVRAFNDFARDGRRAVLDQLRVTGPAFLLRDGTVIDAGLIDEAEQGPYQISRDEAEAALDVITRILKDRERKKQRKKASSPDAGAGAASGGAGD